MSTAVLNELRLELDRLYIAGSDLAADDFRLKRLHPKLQALGERAPIFKRLAEGVEGLTQLGNPPETSASRLLDLGLLLTSVLATQGSIEISGEAESLPEKGTNLTTTLTFRQLSELRGALTSTGAGRYETVTSAFKQGSFSDLRLLPLAVQALGDSYVELAEFAMKEIIPSYGAEAVPILADGFDPTGGRPQARRLLALAAIGREEDKTLLAEAAEGGSEEVRIAAIESLGRYAEYTPELIGYSGDSKKGIRQAAYMALAQNATPEGLEKLYTAFSSKDREHAAEAARKHPSESLDKRLAALLRTELQQAEDSGWPADDKQRTASLGRIEALRRALGAAHSSDLDAAYEQIASRSDQYNAVGWARLIEHAADYLEQSERPEALERLFQLEEAEPSLLPYAFRAAAMRLTPREVFNRYGGTLVDKLKLAFGAKKKQRENAIIRTLEPLILSAQFEFFEMPWDETYRRAVMLSSDVIAVKWDERWLDWLIDRDALKLVCAFARPGHARAEKYIKGKLKEKPDLQKNDAADLIRGLERLGSPDSLRHEMLLHVLEYKPNSRTYMLEPYLVQQMLKLPREYSERLLALTGMYRYESARQIENVLKEMSR
ncbi:HEAT repeat domain-containing protein [Paenibacillus sp. HN-1]|uniref:HEAT repeat domain-containing protein n=1 Tax=Paenibacillus TaxID=44249 RepID=UPI001CA7D59B|nr:MULTISPECIES: HEAT repeat domain-containing protein [Paenibacillus]MBY9082230.1 HEAT repeat domain-containing protein [Paenibacillus sp. CGMCC 1.18879]MBY9087314.1 HEAT repeat domain-containing protein [Paenibacillus sinensis]